MTDNRLSADARRVLAAQGVRAFAYGFGSVLLGVTLHQRGFSSTDAGVVLAAVVTGTVLASLFVGRYADRLGRRRCYAALYLLLAVVGVVFAFADQVWLLAIVALAGPLSTEVVESGPFTSLEQVMLASELAGDTRLRGFGVYNAVASAAGSLGALAAAGLEVLHDWWPGAPRDQRFFLLFVPIAVAGAAIARSLSAKVELPVGRDGKRRTATKLAVSRPAVTRLSALFALDSFGGGFVIQAFLAYWFATKFGASVATVAFVFFAVGVLQTASFLIAPRLARRFGILRTMVFTHLPSNVLLGAIALAPTLGVAMALLLARTALSQMDVPTRQAYVMALDTPEERTAAAAYTNTARYVVRPLGPVLAGAAQSVALGLPFALASSIKGAYDLVLWRWFSGVPLPQDDDPVVPERASMRPTEEQRS